jgi:hypothetical protein
LACDACVREAARSIGAPPTPLEEKVGDLVRTGLDVVRSIARCDHRRHVELGRRRLVESTLRTVAGDSDPTKERS